MKIALASDHAGYKHKELVKRWLKDEGAEVVDFGAHRHDSKDDYPDFVAPAAKAVARGRVDRAIVFGGSGQGEAIVANRFRGVRAAVYYGGDQTLLKLSRHHNNANVLSIGARFVDEHQLLIAVEHWLDEEFMGEPRHRRRIEKIDHKPSARYHQLVEQMGWVGVAFVVGAYLANVLGVLSGDDIGYLLANVVGAFGIMVDARKDHNWQAVVLNAIWFAIGMLGIAHFFLG